jgi:hypothetical protein
MITATTPRREAVSPDYRNEITGIAAWLLPEPERGNAALVKVIAETILDWVSQAVGKDDVQHRMRAMRHQKANTPDTYRRAPAGGMPGWVRVPSLTLDEFLAEAGILYGFIAAGGK